MQWINDIHIIQLGPIFFQLPELLATFILARYSLRVFLSCWTASSALRLQKKISLSQFQKSLSNIEKVKKRTLEVTVDRKI